MSEEDKSILDEYKEVRNAIENFMNMLKEYGWELNDDGEIIDSKTKKLVMGGDEDE